jgi:hypothetical protein
MSEGVVAAVEKVQLARVHRENRARQFRSAMRFQIGWAVRTAMRPTSARPAIVSKPAVRSRRPAHRHTHSLSRRGPPSPASSDDDPEHDDVAPVGVVA